MSVLLCSILESTVFGILNSQLPIQLIEAAIWGAVFVAPTTLVFGFLPVLVILIILDYKAVRTRGTYVMVWSLVSAGPLLPAIVAPSIFLFALIPALLTGMVVGMVYWRLLGKSAGSWQADDRSGSPARQKAVFRFVGGAIALYFAYVAAGYVWYAGKAIWVTYVVEPDRGSPPFRPLRTQAGSDGLSLPQRVAVFDFPDVRSCLEDDVGVINSNALHKLDWDKINNLSEFEVCAFRLLAASNSLPEMTPWLEAQGFRETDERNSARPHALKDGTLVNTGYYSISENGPKFPTRGYFRRLLASMGHSISIDTIWSADGRRLISVEAGITTL